MRGLPAGLSGRASKDVKMQPELRGELHRHVALVATEDDRAAPVATHPAAAGVSLLRFSVPARLLIVALAASLLWSAVLWALQ
jgi:hypothetical protein